jgi:hypothetical protein
MIMQTQESDLRTLFNLIKNLNTKHITIFKQERGYKIMSREPAMDPRDHLKLIGLKQFETLEAALSSYVLYGEISNNEG